MKAWLLDGLGGPFTFDDVPVPSVRPGSVLIRMQASTVMSYMQAYVKGKLPIYRAPPGPFVPGGSGIGVIHEVGDDVWHLRPGQRVAISSHLVAQENVRNPGQILLGITGQGDVAARMQQHWPNGTLAEYALVPASVVTPAEGLDELSAPQLAVTMRHLIPYGGLLRSRLAAGETVVVSGATGAYGSAAVMVALAMGARQIVAMGRDPSKLDSLVAAAGPRVKPFAASGDSAADAIRLNDMTGGGADVAFDMVGGATDPNMTLAALRSLAPGGRLVLMGSMTVPLPLPYLEVMLNGWEIMGCFMYPANAYRRLLDLCRGGLLDPTAIHPRGYALADLPDAMIEARRASSLECIVMNHES